MTLHRYTVILEREEDGSSHGFVPALKGCHSQGDTEEEALTNAKEAISGYLESLTANGDPIPEEDLMIRRLESGFDRATFDPFASSHGLVRARCVGSVLDHKDRLRVCG
jgi:predicted RNase H-like HicB family nuclease